MASPRSPDAAARLTDEKVVIELNPRWRVIVLDALQWAVQLHTKNGWYVEAYCALRAGIVRQINSYTGLGIGLRPGGRSGVDLKIGAVSTRLRSPPCLRCRSASLRNRQSVTDRSSGENLVSATTPAPTYPSCRCQAGTRHSVRPIGPAEADHHARLGQHFGQVVIEVAIVVAHRLQHHR